jgi:phosphoenolpyruvate synthase/pyruvate phosphate dikinase
MIRPLSEMSRSSIAFGGIKAAYLGELLNAGFRVPDGFVISADAERLDEKAILKNFDSLGCAFVSVRSSPAPPDPDKVRWVGELESRVWVCRDTLMKAIQACKDSARSKRARIYMSKHGITEHVKVAILVHETIAADSSGVVFTQSHDCQDKVVINACFGSGLGAVTGKVVPDCYITNKKGDIIEEIIHEQWERHDQAGWVQINPQMRKEKKLSQAQVKELVEVAKNIENHFEKPQDIEFCFNKEELWILQARPLKLVS